MANSDRVAQLHSPALSSLCIEADAFVSWKQHRTEVTGLGIYSFCTLDAQTTGIIIKFLLFFSPPNQR